MTRYQQSATLAALIVAVALAVGVPAYHSTPDGEVPAEETLCDILRDSTPGLFGLCVAYCEAQDCDFDGARSGQCQAPNPRLLANYERKRGHDDPPMPCLIPEAECPCFSAEDLQALPLDSCVEVDFETGFYMLVANSSWDEDTGQSGALVEVDASHGNGRCMYRDFIHGMPPVLSDTSTDPSQTDACLRIVEDHIEAGNLACEQRD